MGQVLKTVWLDMIRVVSITVTFCQIATALTNLPQVQWPANFLHYLDRIDFVNLDFLEITGIACGVQITVSDDFFTWLNCLHCHALTHIPVETVWCSMLARCSSPPLSL